MGKTHRERLFRAGNQLGKTYSGAAEAAYHSTGLYPTWWEGRVFTHPTVGWVAGLTSELTRDNAQRLLIGAKDQRGTGLIPYNKIMDVTSARGISDLADTITVEHISGRKSLIKLKSYEQGRAKFQGESIHWGWGDEEAPEDVYSEFLTRTNATKGMLFTTFTPLLGMSEVVRKFMVEPTADRADILMTIDEAEHIDAEQRQIIINSYPKHEREARTMGTPIMGSGLIFPVDEKDITVAPFAIPDHWKILGAIDFGYDHPTACVKLSLDADTDCMYVTHCYRSREQTPVFHAATMRAWGDDYLPWAWPHDGFQHDKGSGIELAQQYRDQKINMIGIHAQFDGKRGNGVEAGVTEMLDRMLTNRLKVFSNCADWLEERRMYHRKDGLIVKEYEDLMAATRYGMMMLRYAVPKKPVAKKTFVGHSGSPNGWMG